MPRATPLPVRQAIRRRSLQGQLPKQIALDLGLCVRTVRHLLNTGKADAPADYSNCGRPGSIAAPLRQAILDLRAESPGWGAPFLRCWLPRLGFADPPSARALQRLLADEPAPPPPPPPPPRGRRPAPPPGAGGAGGPAAPPRAGAPGLAGRCRRPGPPGR